MLSEVLWLLIVRCSWGPDSKQGGGGEKGQIMKTLEKHTHTHTDIGGGRSRDGVRDRYAGRKKREKTETRSDVKLADVQMGQMASACCPTDLT